MKNYGSAFFVILFVVLAQFLIVDISAQSNGAYFPPPESRGGWRKLADPNDIKKLAGMGPSKLDEIKEWLFQSTNILAWLGTARAPDG